MSTHNTSVVPGPLATKGNTARPKILITIPAGTLASQCSSGKCGQTIYFAPHPTTGKMHPVSIEDAHGRAPTSSVDGQGISHYADCKDRERFRRTRP